MSRLPPTERAARRSLKFWDTENGRVIVGSMWLDMRIIADTHSKAVEAALQVYRAMRGN